MSLKPQVSFCTDVFVSPVCSTLSSFGCTIPVLTALTLVFRIGGMSFCWSSCNYNKILAIVPILFYYCCPSLLLLPLHLIIIVTECNSVIFKFWCLKSFYFKNILWFMFGNNILLYTSYIIHLFVQWPWSSLLYF